MDYLGSEWLHGCIMYSVLSTIVLNFENNKGGGLSRPLKIFFIRRLN